MANDEVYLKPDDYQKQVNDIEEKSKELEALVDSYYKDNGGNRLASVDKLLEAVKVFSEAMGALNELEKLDVRTYNNIKAAWMDLDSYHGNKTAGELLMDLLTGKKS